MPVLKCLARYKSRIGEWEPGQRFEASEAEAAFYQADAPGAFEVETSAPNESKGVTSPPVDKMISVADRAKARSTLPGDSGPGLPPSTAQAVAAPGALTVAELKALDLTVDEWKLLLRAERRDKNRATAVALIEEKIKEAQESV